MSLKSVLRPRSLLNPVSRLALATFAWKHRHEILRWGRSLYGQLVGRRDASPARAVRIGKVLFAIADDPALRNAKELKRVAMDDDVVDLEVDEHWPQLPRLIDRVKRVSGVRSVVVNGTTAAEVHPALPVAAAL